MDYRLMIWPREADPTALLPAIEALGVRGVESCRAGRLVFLRADLDFDTIRQLAADLLADPVTEDFAVMRAAEVAAPQGREHTIEVTRLPGVTDPAAESLLEAAHRTGYPQLERAAVGAYYRLTGDLGEEALHTLAVRLFANPVVEQTAVDAAIMPPFMPVQATDDTVEVIAVRDRDAEGLLALSSERRLALNLAEMQAIRAYFTDEGRDPTDAELETLAQTWSEHCVHKTFKAHITYNGPPPGPDAYAPPVEQTVGSLLGDYIRRATDELDRSWVQSAFVDNAGIVAFIEGWSLAFKVETHNHPSALEPFGGANTGIGGVIRDVLGVSARPIANTDVLCFGPRDLPDSDLPEGVLHPRRIEQGVIAGIEDYGNKMGIPTVNGAVIYHPGYVANPLVYCGCLGILPEGAHPTDPQPGDLIVVLGGRTGRDGLRGATFSSMEMDTETEAIAGTAVQIGHPINEKQVLEVVLAARDAGLYNAITDCGAGGLSSAVGEMGEHIGARVQLADVPLKYPGLRPWEIWLSEAQERMVLAVPPENWEQLAALAADHDIEAVRIGAFEPTGRLTLHYGDKPVGDMAMAFLHDGLPPRHMVAEWRPPPHSTLSLPEPPDLTPALLSLLAHPTIASKEHIVRIYDHEVQGGTVVKPMVGAAGTGPGDSSVLLPLDTARQKTGVALAVGINPLIADPYAMAWAAVDEALRNAVAAGANPDRIAILDNFAWGSPHLPDRLGALVRCAQGCYDAAKAYRTPFISGKDSLNNEYTDSEGTRRAIPGTLLVSALGIVPDVEATATSDFKQAGSLIYVVGATADELGGSHYALINTDPGGTPPQPQPDPLATLRGIYAAQRAGILRAVHDCSEGGLAVALAEMCIGGRLGAEVDLALAPGAGDIERSDAVLFSESLTRFVVTVSAADMQTLHDALAGVPHAHIGQVTGTGRLVIRAWATQPVVDADLLDLEAAWRGAPVTEKPEAEPESATYAAPAVHTTPPKVAILHAKGTNRDRDAALACEVAGGDPRVVLVNHLLDGTEALDDYAMLVIPGGFSYGDDLGAGVIWATTLQAELGEQIARFVADGRPTLGICNGFQVLVKAGILPDLNGQRPVTLTYNESGRFECRWVYLKPQGDSPFTAGLTELIHCPVAHGEGRLVARDEDTLNRLAEEGSVALTYVNAVGAPVGYPGNPNGSQRGIAGLARGSVLGLMPHPEDHIFPWQHPRRHRGITGMSGLPLFVNGIKAAR